MEIEKDMKYTKTMRFLLISASFVIIVAGMRAAQVILVPFLLSIFIAIISSPLLFWLRRKGLPMGISLLVVIAVILRNINKIK